jgi:hypothetical protein
MKIFDPTAYAWVLEPPQETLAAGALDALPRWTLYSVFFSSLFSFSLAKTLMASALVTSSRPVPFLGELFANLLLPAMAFMGILVLTYEILRLSKTDPVPFRSWAPIGMAALIPLHLTLPLALLCRPMGVGGLVLYSLAEAVIYLAVIRRWAWGVQTVCAWPLWASYLLVLSPVLLGCAVLLVFSAFLMASVMIVFLAALA